LLTISACRACWDFRLHLLDPCGAR
jgi:hypothetical protein